MATRELRSEGGLIYEQQEDGGWTVVASAITGTPRDEELAALLARAPVLETQRDTLLAACKAAYRVMADDDKYSDRSFFDYDAAVDMVLAAINAAEEAS